MSDLDPLPPEDAVDLYLDARRDDAAKWTVTSHKYRLRPFVEWCREAGIENLNEVNGRDLYEYRVWRREGGYSNANVEELAPATLESALQTLKRFLKFAADIEAVPEDLYTKVPIPDLSKTDEVSDSKIPPERIPPILDYLDRYEYASRDHVVVLVLWHTGARLGGVRSLDLRDLDLDSNSPAIEFHHRPDTDTPLKNDEASERHNRINAGVAQVLEDFIEGPRREITDDYGRRPLVTTTQGRACRGTIRETVYKWTRPCFVGEGCPHGREIEECEATAFKKSTKCPSSRSPHDFRKARVTKYRNDGVAREIVSDRLNASEDVLDKHYDRASKRRRAERRWDAIDR
ncbi:site-specific integrase [Halobacterium litoreum]|uniref:Site-specific integrase n=1 Tax=Halobacterium litoreum TaxID=2039234 RepID=A0ABD5NHD5_9EURY|nr:site-specific integrase [Halobacterium litoreum]UHH12408.1 site-specific integrase [Halobacterium litoreum]